MAESVAGFEVVEWEVWLVAEVDWAWICVSDEAAVAEAVEAEVWEDVSS